MNFGQKIRRARKAKGLSLEELGQKMGHTRQLVWQWENFVGDDVPAENVSDPRKHIEKLCQVLDVPYEYFYGDSPSHEPLEAKIRHLLPQERSIIEAAIDGIIAQRTDAKRTM